MGRTHAEAFHRDPRATLVAVADPHLSEEPASEGNLDAQEEFVLPGDVAIHASATDLLARDDIDAVVVAAPTVFHADLAVAVLESGRHLLVEKPLALDSTEAARVARAGASRPDLVAWPAMCMRFWPEWKYLRDGLRSGQWGGVQQARFERIGAIPSWGGDFFKDHTKSGGAILDLHIHDVDFVRSCFGDPDRVRTFGRRGPAVALTMCTLCSNTKISLGECTRKARGLRAMCLSCFGSWWCATARSCGTTSVPPQPLRCMLPMAPSRWTCQIFLRARATSIKRRRFWMRFSAKRRLS